MIRGTFTEFSLPELIRLVSETHKTGVLEITGAEGSGRLLFLDGCVCGSHTAAAREPLGRKLVRAEAVTEPELWRALDDQTRTHQRLGQVLIARGSTTLEQVQAALREQIEDGGIDIIALGPTEFEWKSEPPDESSPVLISPETFLHGLAERVREIEEIRARIPEADSVVSINPSPPGDPLDLHISRTEWRMLSLLGARRTVGDLTQYSGSGDIHTLRALYRLIEGGLIELGPADKRGPRRREGRRPHRLLQDNTAPMATTDSDRVIRLADALGPGPNEPLSVAIVATSNRPHALLGAALLRKAAADLPVHVRLFRLDDLGPVAPSAEALLQAEDLGVELSSPPSRQLRKGELSESDLVIGLDWWHVDRAVLYGAAHRDRAFTIDEFLELVGGLPETQEPRLVVRARGLIAAAHAERTLTSTLGSPDPEVVQGAFEDSLESWSRLARVLFSSETVGEIS